MSPMKDGHVGESHENYASVAHQSTEMIMRSIRGWVRAVFMVLVVIWLTILTGPVLIPRLFVLFFHLYS